MNAAEAGLLAFTVAVTAGLLVFGKETVVGLSPLVVVLEAIAGGRSIR